LPTAIVFFTIYENGGHITLYLGFGWSDVLLKGGSSDEITNQIEIIINTHGKTIAGIEQFVYC